MATLFQISGTHTALKGLSALERCKMILGFYQPSGLPSSDIQIPVDTQDAKLSPILSYTGSLVSFAKTSIKLYLTGPPSCGAVTALWILASLDLAIHNRKPVSLQLPTKLRYAVSRPAEAYTCTWYYIWLPMTHLDISAWPSYSTYCYSSPARPEIRRWTFALGGNDPRRSYTQVLCIKYKTATYALCMYSVRSSHDRLGRGKSLSLGQRFNPPSNQ